jgi:hypothetical protein
MQELHNDKYCKRLPKYHNKKSKSQINIDCRVGAVGFIFLFVFPPATSHERLVSEQSCLSFEGVSREENSRSSSEAAKSALKGKGTSNGGKHLILAIK